MNRFSQVVVLLLGVGAASPAFAQINDFQFLLTPYILQPRDPSTLSIRGTYFGDEDDVTLGNDWEQNELNLNYRYALKREPDEQYYLALDAYRLGIQNNVPFSASGIQAPDQLADVSSGIVFRKDLDNDWSVGGTFRIGSASDDLFHSLDEMYAGGTGVIQIPWESDPSKSWVIAFNVDTRRRAFPLIGGVGYGFFNGTKTYGVIGIPFLMLGGRDSRNKWNYSVSYIPLRDLHARLDYKATRKLIPYAAFDWTERFFSRAGRVDNDDFLLYQDKRISLGLAYRIASKTTIDIRGGFAFDRELSDDDESFETDNNRVRAEDTWFVSASLLTRF